MKIPKYLYHATTKENMPSIEQNGLGGISLKKMWPYSKENTVYLSEIPNVASGYVDILFRTPVLLKINTNGLNENLFEKDNSDMSGSSWEYRGIIPWSKIIQVSPVQSINNMNWYKKSIKEYNKLKDGEYYISDFMKPKLEPKTSPFDTKSKWIPVKSSFIESISYYKPLKIFEIRLRNGREYSYSGVPESVYKNFMKSKSKGEFFNRVIKKRYPVT